MVGGSKVTITVGMSSFISIRWEAWQCSATSPVLAQTASSPQRSDGSAVGENPTLDQRAAVGASLANGRYADIGIIGLTEQAVVVRGSESNGTGLLGKACGRSARGSLAAVSLPD
jgi:hypothetical protein